MWLWWLVAPQKLSRRAQTEIDRSASIGVSAISCWEVGMLAALERISLDRDVRIWTAMALQRERVVALDVTPEIALDAAFLTPTFPGDPADRLLYATARRYRARLITRDRRLHKADPAATVW